MKPTFRHLSIGLALFSLICFQTSTGRAQQVTAFTYQGQLKSNNFAANGNFAMSFALYNVASNGTAVAGPVVINPVVVTNGLFTVLLDFGAAPYASPSNWLNIAVGTNTNSLSNLSPRQLLTPTPYAIVAGSASNVLGTVPAGQINGNVPGVLLSNTVLAVNCPFAPTNFSPTPTLLQTIGAFTKGSGSTVEVTFNGKLYVQTMATNTAGAIFELRVDNTASTRGVARANLWSSQAGSPGVFASIKGVFTGLAPGSHTVSMWISCFSGGGGSNAQLDPGCWGTDHVVVNEFQ